MPIPSLFFSSFKPVFRCFHPSFSFSFMLLLLSCLFTFCQYFYTHHLPILHGYIAFHLWVGGLAF